MSQNVKEIITDLDELTKNENEVINPKKEGTILQEITLALKSTMRDKKLNFLSAPQIGYSKRVFCIRDGVDSFKTFVNPMSLKVWNKTVAYDSCASIPNKGYLIYRFNDMKVGFMTPLGEFVESHLTKEVAWAAQQCIEILDGITLDNYGMKIVDMDDPDILDNWKDFTEEQQDEVRRMYIESLDGIYKKDAEMSESDEEIKNIRNGIKFMTSVANGETEVIPTYEKSDEKKDSTD